MLPLKLKESIHHWISRDRSHQLEIYCCSYQVCLVLHKLLHTHVQHNALPLEPIYLFESRTFETFLVLLNPCHSPSTNTQRKGPICICQKTTQQSEKLSSFVMAIDLPSYRRLAICENHLSSVNRISYVRHNCDKTVHKQLPQTSNLKITHEPWSLLK